jgi:hypothetical protein
MTDIMTDEPGVPPVIDRSTFQAQLDALRVRSNGQWGRTRMVSDTIGLAGSKDPQSRQWTKASAACLLSLVATPTFAIMAVLTAIHGRSMPDMLCSTVRDGAPLTGMFLMYLLMSAFHLGPWLKLISRRGRDAGPNFSRRRGRGSLRRPSQI